MYHMLIFAPDYEFHSSKRWDETADTDAVLDILTTIPYMDELLVRSPVALDVKAIYEAYMKFDATKAHVTTLDDSAHVHYHCMAVWGATDDTIVVIIDDILYKRDQHPVRITAGALTGHITFPVQTIKIGWQRGTWALDEVGGGTVPARSTRRHPLVPENRRYVKQGIRVGSLKRARP
jgi:hypothetical protein